MGKINKSFIVGVIIASFTWIISLYLYWSLIKSSNTVNFTSSAVDKSMLINDNNNQKYVYDDNDKHKQKYNENDLFSDKMLRYKKEKKFRKISQKLIDQMRPIVNTPKSGIKIID